MITSIGIALTGLTSASLRINASASNIANIATSGSLIDDNNAPYTPLTTSSKTSDNGGVQTKIIPSDNPFTPAFAPDSPLADKNGFIGVPNLDLASDIVNMKMATISYKANLNIIKVAGNMFDELLNATDNRS